MAQSTAGRTAAWSILGLLLGLLSFPLGSRQVLGAEALSLLLGLAAMVVAGIAYFGHVGSSAGGEGGKPELNPWLLAAVLLAVVVGNVSRPWLTTMLAAVLIMLVSAFFLQKAGPTALRGLLLSYALGGALLGAHGVAYFAHARAKTTAPEPGLASVPPAAAAPHPTEVRPFDLKPYVNIGLRDSFFDDTLYDDSFAALPAGRQVLGGVPFQIDGIVMLSGQLSVKYGFKYPKRIEISTHVTCQRLHFLNAISDDSNENYGLAIGEIVLKYANGTQAAVELVVGYNTLNRLGLASENLDDLRSTIAWTGVNGLTKSLTNMAFIKLRLCDTVIVNPHPELEVQSVVYQSRELRPSPMLVALTTD